MARYGGEEFVVLLNDTSIEGAKVVAADLIETVSKLGIPHATSPIAPYVTISIGIAFSVNESKLSKEELFERADKALYEAKQSGRNRFTVSDYIALKK